MQSFGPAVSHKVCTKCGYTYPAADERYVCAIDGALLQAVTTDPFIGMTLAQRYEIVSLLGSGGWSSVYLGRQVSLKKPVAIKILQSHLVSQPGSVKRFEAEARIASKLQHPNIVAINDYGLMPQPFIVMEFVDGQTMSDLIKEKERIEPGLAVNLFVQLCDAMSAVHDAGLIHRDLKPSNILLVKSGDSNYKLKLVDFGLVKNLSIGDDSLHELTKTGEVFGSPPYMSPEQFGSGNTDARSDIYSMGCLMYEAITGRKVFEARTSIDWLTMHATCSPKPFLDACPELIGQKWLEAIVFRALEKEPEARYQTMRQMRGDLALVSQGRKPLRMRGSGMMHQLPYVETGDRLRNVRPAMLSLVIVLSLVAVVAIVERKHVENIYWQYLFDQGSNLLKSSSFAEAEDKLSAAVGVAANFGSSDSRLIRSQRELLQAYKASGKWSEATALNERIELETGQRPTPEWTRLFTEAVRYRDKYRYAESELEFKRAIAEAEKLSPNNLCLAESLEGLGHLYKLERNYKLAEAFCQRALTMKQKLLDHFDIRIAASLKNLGEVLRQEGQSAQAIQLYLPAIAIVEKNLGPDHADLSAYLSDLGVAYRNNMQYPEAESAYKRAIDVVQRGRGPMALELAFIFDAYAELLRQTNRREEAYKLLKQSVVIMEKNQGSDYPGLDTNLNRLGLVCLQLNKLVEASEAFKRAVEVRSAVEPRHPNVALNRKLYSDVQRMLSHERNARRS